MAEFLTCKCGSTRLKKVLTPDSIHHSKLVCEECGSYIKFLPKPKSEKIDISRSLNKGLLKGIKKGFCAICRRSEPNLPSKVVLEAHHIIPKKDGGTDDKGNLLEVCSDCHKMIHHLQRTFEPYCSRIQKQQELSKTQ